MSRKQNGRARPACLLALALIVTASVLVTALTAPLNQAAAASRFVYETCDSALPGGNVPGASWSLGPNGPFIATQNCATPGGSIGVSQTGGGSGQAALAVAMPETPCGFIEEETMVGVTSGLADGNLPSHIQVLQNEISPFPGANVQSLRRFILRNQRGEIFPCVDSSLFPNDGDLNVVVVCELNKDCPGGAYVGARNIAATQVDPTPPIFSAVAGSLLEGGVIRGHAQSLTAVAHDVGGGLSRVWVSVNGTPAAETPLGCQVAAVSNLSVVGLVALTPSPCPAAAPLTWTLDTEKFPFTTGSNLLAVCASDFATIGPPNTTCSPPTPITVDNTCDESPVSGGSQLSAQFSETASNTVTVKHDETAQVNGALTTAVGEPVSGATLCVKETVMDASHRVKAEGSLTTDAQGHYSYDVKPGPNRELLVGYRRDAAQINQSLRYSAHARPTIKAKRQKVHNGELIEFSGRIPRPNAAERTVILQAGSPGDERWLTIRKAVTRSGGEWRSGYRPTHTTVATTYEFRVVVPRQANYAWDAGASRPVDIRVKPRKGRRAKR